MEVLPHFIFGETKVQEAQKVSELELGNPPPTPFPLGRKTQATTHTAHGICRVQLPCARATEGALVKSLFSPHGALPSLPSSTRHPCSRQRAPGRAALAVLFVTQQVPASGPRCSSASFIIYKIETDSGHWLTNLYQTNTHTLSSTYTNNKSTSALAEV